MEWLSFPITEKIHREVLSLPLNPTLSDSDVNRISGEVNNYSPSVLTTG